MYTGFAASASTKSSPVARASVKFGATGPSSGGREVSGAFVESGAVEPDEPAPVVDVSCWIVEELGLEVPSVDSDVEGAHAATRSEKVAATTTRRFMTSTVPADSF